MILAESRPSRVFAKLFLEGTPDEVKRQVRKLRERLVKSEAWIQKPKPKVDAPPPRDNTNGSDLIGRMKLLFDLVSLALQTDSSGPRGKGNR